MDDKFEKLPADKRDRFINGALAIFGRHEYRKASVEEIVGKAGISKGLLYHYFPSKRELYIELYRYSCAHLSQQMKRYIDPGETDFFALMNAGMGAKMTVLAQYPSMLDFIVKAYYETDPAVAQEIGAFNEQLMARQEFTALAGVDREKFRPDVSLSQAIRILQWCAEGYLMHMREAGTLDLQTAAAEFEPCLNIFRRAFYKEEFI